MANNNNGMITQNELSDSLNKKINDSDTNSKLNKQQIGSLPSLRTNSKDTLVNSINELFQYASNGKTLVANAITGKGVQSNSNMTFQQLATNISNIKAGYSVGDLFSRFPLDIAYNEKYDYKIYDRTIPDHRYCISYNESNNIIRLRNKYGAIKFINLNKLPDPDKKYRLEDTGYEGLEFVSTKDASLITTTKNGGRGGLSHIFVTIFVKLSNNVFSHFSSVPNNYFEDYSYMVLPNDDIILITGGERFGANDVCMHMHYYTCIKHLLI